MIDYELLVGSSVHKKVDAGISLTLFTKVEADFLKLRGFWGRSLYLHFLKQYKDKTIAACSDRIMNNIKIQEPAIYNRYIKPYSIELSRLQAIDVTGKEIKNKLRNELIEFGDTEFIIIGKVLQGAEFHYIDDLKKEGIILSFEAMNQINKGYEN